MYDLRSTGISVESSRPCRVILWTAYYLNVLQVGSHAGLCQFRIFEGLGNKLYQQDQYPIR